MALKPKSHGSLRRYDHAAGLGDVDVLDGLLPDFL
jgi:hypothetical protein